MSLVRIAVAGHVDHGKSTLLGRILMDLGAVAPELLDKARGASARQGRELEPAFLFDAFEEEQSQGVTIDTTRVRLDFEGRSLVLIDVPGHVEFLRNAATGACEAELGILVVDAQEGLREQSLRHLRLLAFLGVPEVLVAVNKMDRVGFSRDGFRALAEKAEAAVRAEGLLCAGAVPVAALHGDNLLRPSERSPWYDGAPLLPRAVAAAQARQAGSGESSSPLRIALQDVYRFEDERFYAGRVLGGVLRKGDEVLFSPSGRSSRVVSVLRGGREVQEARKGDSVALTLGDRVFVERGELLTRPDQPPCIETRLRVRLAWIGAAPLQPASTYLLKAGTAEVPCRVRAESAANGDFIEAELLAERPLAFDETLGRDALNRVVLCTSEGTVAVAMVLAPQRGRVLADRNADVVVRETGYLTRAQREAAGTRGAVVWLTGLSGSGKTTLAKELERRLHAAGRSVLALDGDNLRHGLCSDLGFTPEDRAENIRRIAHVARLALDAGSVVLVAAISPYAEDRETARGIIGASDFREVHLSCPIDVCRERDPKGLYAKASKGELPGMTGLAAPYQPPAHPALRLDSSRLSVAQEAQAVLDLLAAQGTPKETRP